MNELDIPEMGVPYELMERLSIAEQHEYLQQKVRRNRRSSGLNRRDFLRFSGVAAVAASALAPGMSSTFRAPTLLVQQTGTVDASVKPMGRHLAWAMNQKQRLRLPGRQLKRCVTRTCASVPLRGV